MPKQSVTSFTYYSFRYDYDDDDVIEKIRKYIVSQYPKYAIFKEVSSEVSKKHIQGKIGKALSLVQIRKHFKAEFPDLFVKSNYSIGEIKDEDKYDSYICKDGDVLCNNIFTPEYIADAVELHKNKVTEFNIKQKTRVGVLPFTHKVRDDFLLEFPVETKIIQYVMYKPNDYEKKVYNDACKSLLRFLLKRLGKIAKVFDDNILQRMYTGIKNSIIMLDPLAESAQTDFYENRIQL